MHSRFASKTDALDIFEWGPQNTQHCCEVIRICVLLRDSYLQTAVRGMNLKRFSSASKWIRSEKKGMKNGDDTMESLFIVHGLSPASFQSPESGLVPPDSSQDPQPAVDPPHDLTVLTSASPARNSS